MITTSLCLTLRGDAPTLEECLRSCCRCFDEIVVAEVGASGPAQAVARRFADRYFHYQWQGDASDASNFAFSKATCDYIMWLEPEDILLPADARRLWRLHRSLPPDTDAVVMCHNLSFDAQGLPNVRAWPVRMVRRAAGILWQGRVHPLLPESGTVRRADVAVTRRDAAADGSAALAAYDALRRGEETLSLPERLDYARCLRDAGRFAEAAEEFEAVLAQEDAPDRVEVCFELSFCYEKLGAQGRMQEALLRSLLYAPPQATVCCRIGEQFFARGEWRSAAYWYEQALKSETLPDSGVQYTDYLGYIPALQLCLCYYRLGDVTRAVEMNRMAARFKPGDASVLANERFFADPKHRAE